MIKIILLLFIISAVTSIICSIMFEGNEKQNICSCQFFKACKNCVDKEWNRIVNNDLKRPGNINKNENK